MAAEGAGASHEARKPRAEPAAVLRARDNLELAVYRWQPDGARGAVVLVHGYAEHAGRYAALVRDLNARGVAVWALDLRGHGRSPGPRADVRLFAEYVEDVRRLVEEVREASDGRRPVLFGHSMGGAIALRLALEHPEQLRALALSSPFLRPADPPPGWLLATVRVLARLAPMLPVQPLDARVLSRDPEAVAAYRQDPLVYTGALRARLGRELVSAGPPLLQRAPELELPTLVLHGSADALADPAASRELAGRLGGDDVRLEVVQGGYHELLHDLDRDAVRRLLTDWLVDHLAAPAGAGDGSSGGRPAGSPDQPGSTR